MIKRNVGTLLTLTILAICLVGLSGCKGGAKEDGPQPLNSMGDDLNIAQSVRIQFTDRDINVTVPHSEATGIVVIAGYPCTDKPRPDSARPRIERRIAPGDLTPLRLDLPKDGPRIVEVSAKRKDNKASILFFSSPTGQ